MSKESFKVGRRLVEIIKSLVSSDATRWTEGEGGLGLVMQASQMVEEREQRVLPSRT